MSDHEEIARLRAEVAQKNLELDWFRRETQRLTNERDNVIARLRDITPLVQVALSPPVVVGSNGHGGNGA